MKLSKALMLMLFVTIGWLQAAIARPSEKPGVISFPTEIPAEILRSSHEPEALYKSGNKCKISENTNTKDYSILPDSASPTIQIDAAINPRDTNNIVVSATEFAPGDGVISEKLNYVVYFTRDFGRSWKKSGFRPLPGRDSAMIVTGASPSLAFDGTGKLYMSWSQTYITLKRTDSTTLGIDSIFSGVYWAYSTDGGETWQEEKNKTLGGLFCGNHYTSGMTDLPFNTYALTSTANQSKHEDINSVYVGYTYATFANGRQTVHILMNRKKADSSCFQPEQINISQNSGLYNHFSSLDMDDKGGLHALFMKVEGETQASLQASLMYSKSYDNGSTFYKPVEICKFTGTEQNSGPVESVSGISQIYPCPAIAVDKSNTDNNENVYITFTANGIEKDKKQGTDIYFSRSTDGGESWSEPIVLNDDVKTLKHSNFYSSISVNENGVIIVSWYDRRNDWADSKTEYYMAYSFDGGKSFTKNIKVSGTASKFTNAGNKNSGAGIGTKFKMLSTGSCAMPFWTEDREENGDVKIYMAKVPIGDGATVVEDVAAVAGLLELGSPNPNPAGLACSIVLDNRGTENVIMSITDLSGRDLRQIDCSRLKQGRNSLEIDLSGLAPGVYYIAARTNSERAMKKLIIER